MGSSKNIMRGCKKFVIILETWAKFVSFQLQDEAVYEAKFHALLRYAMVYVNKKEERIQLFIRSLKFELIVPFFSYMTFGGRIFNEVTDYVKKTATSKERRSS